MNNLQHFFFDGYDIDNELLGNVSYVKSFIKEINIVTNTNEDEVTIVPYFNGKVEEDGGISCLILSKYFHFTCHTFSFKNTVFIDCFGLDNCNEKILPIILKYFKTNNYDLCTENQGKGNFGKHAIISCNPINYEESIQMIKKIVSEIKMTPINDILTSYTDEQNFDVLQLIAESHISIHRKDNNMVVDAFSCKNFDEKKVSELFNESANSITIINRGIKYR